MIFPTRHREEISADGLWGLLRVDCFKMASIPGWSRETPDQFKRMRIGNRRTQENSDTPAEITVRSGSERYDFIQLNIGVRNGYVGTYGVQTILIQYIWLPGGQPNQAKHLPSLASPNVFIWNAWPLLYGVLGMLIAAVHLDNMSTILANQGFLGALNGMEGSFLVGLISIVYSIAIAAIPFLAKSIVNGDVGSAARPANGCVRSTACCAESDRELYRDAAELRFLFHLYP
jgi:hypothetical protein